MFIALIVDLFCLSSVCLPRNRAMNATNNIHLFQPMFNNQLIVHILHCNLFFYIVRTFLFRLYVFILSIRRFQMAPFKRQVYLSKLVRRFFTNTIYRVDFE